MVEYHLISAKDQSRIHQFGKKVLPGLFIGYALYAERIWKGDVLVADLEELETVDASEIYSKKTQCERGDISQPKGEIIFPIADGRIETLGGDQDLRTSTLVRHRPIRGESCVDFLRESEGSLPPQDALPDAGEETTFGGQGDGVPKAGQKQAAADSRGSRTCVCASTLLVVGNGTRRGGRMI